MQPLDVLHLIYHLQLNQYTNFSTGARDSNRHRSIIYMQQASLNSTDSSPSNNFGTPTGNTNKSANTHVKTGSAQEEAGREAESVWNYN